jgi:glycosyltransferase involved in cell wall biosynthesis
MPDGVLQPQISAILHLTRDIPYPLEKFYNIVKAILQQYEHALELVIFDERNDKDVAHEISKMNTEGNPIQFINGQIKTQGAWLNAALNKANGEYLLYLDNRSAEIYLKQSAAVSFLLACERNPACVMVYADYEIEQNGVKKEVHLLKHHVGRVRDNQDYGYVYFFKKASIQEMGGFDGNLKFNTLYDMRLKVSEKAILGHIANKYAGSLYRVVAESKKHNVFDYILAGKESQLEAEHVLSQHLKRIKAYLEPGAFYQNRTIPESIPSLKASVIVPVNNRTEFIGIAIESVLNQTVQDIEMIVVVNGGEDDPTVSAVREYMVGGSKYNPKKPEVRLIVLDINNIGLCLNLAMKAARGEYYIQLDSDDRLKPFAVEKILQLFESDPKIGIVIGSYEVWQLNTAGGKIERVESIPVVTHDEWTEENGRNNLLRINGAGAPRSIPFQIISDMGYFAINDEPYARNYGEDYEMVLKISEKYRVGRIWEPIYDVVRHEGGTDHSINQETIDRNDEAKDHMRMQAIQRRIKLNQTK